ncbi:MAG: hypothetical protein E6J42_11380, partial [Chloroflexi bacterium]
MAEQQIHGDLVRDVRASAQSQGALRDLHGSLLLIGQVVVVRQAVRDPGEPPLIAERLRQSLSLLHVVEDARAVRQRHQRAAQIEADVDRLLDELPIFGQVPDRLQRLLEAGHRLSVCGAHGSLRACLAEVDDCLLPLRAPQGVI